MTFDDEQYFISKIFAPFSFSQIIRKRQDSRWLRDLQMVSNIVKKPHSILKNFSASMKLGNCLAIVNIF